MKRTTIIILVALMIILSGLNAADAVPILKLSDGTTHVSVTDNLAGDIDPAAGAMTYLGPVGLFNANVTTGWTFMGSAAIPRLDLNSINFSGGAGTLTISLEEDGYAGLYNPGGFLTEIGGTTTGTVSVSSYIKESGAATWTLIDTLGDFSGPFSGSAQSAWDPGEPYSLKITTVITHDDSGVPSSFNANLTSVPEPGTLIMLGTGLAGLFYVRHKKIFKI